MENITENLSLKNKTKHDVFLFYLNQNINSKDENIPSLIHNFLGQPTLPLLGKYAKEYEMSDVSTLVITTYYLDDILSYKNMIKISDELLNFIKNLDKLSDTIPYKFNSFKFYWLTINNSFKKDPKKSSEVYNIVPHTFLFQNLDFSPSRKRLVKNYPITIYIDNFINKSCGVDILKNNDRNGKHDKNINFNNFRIEYSSTHLIKESLGFSPNNLKFIIFHDFEISHFYLLIIDENELHVFYYWIINSIEKQNKINEICSKSENIKEIINNLELEFGTEDYIENLKNIFKII